MEQEKLTAERKALLVNLEPKFFGTFAEIGAGQEVARYFFRVGGAAGTIAKTMSAYDMTYSDAIYGKVGRYVSKERLDRMLQHEYKLLLERLSEKRGAETAFFAFANTVAARNYKGTNECHGWLGIRFQADPLRAPNDVIIHVRMTDKENLLQQQALGIIGVNLVYGALFLRSDPDAFVTSLLDGLTIDRIEVDMIEMSGPDLAGVDNRLMSLKLLQNNLTNAIMFSPDGHVMQPSEVLYKKPVLVERGSFRPVTYVNVDMMNGARAEFIKDPRNEGKDPMVLYEITLHNLLSSGALDDQDFIARADSLSAIGQTVIISNYSEYYRLSAYFRRYTKEPIGMVVGINALFQIFDERYYDGVEGGILEALGKLFSSKVTMYAYPMTRDAYRKYLEAANLGIAPPDVTSLPELVTANEVLVKSSLQHLYTYLVASGHIAPIREYSRDHLAIFSRDVLNKIKSGDPSWEEAVPRPAAAIIKQRHVFGYKERQQEA